MAISSLTLRLASLLRSGLRYGESKRIWGSYRLSGQTDSDQAILLIGGLSSNAASTNRTLANELSQGKTFTWSRNLYGHTGRFSDFSRSRVWNWIADALVAMRKITSRHRKSDLALVGHSTGGLVVLAILILKQLFPQRLLRGQEQVRLRGVLIFPPFRLQRRLDTRLLWVVAIMYYLICPTAFLLLAFSGPWMWTLSLLAYLAHIYFVPKISVPSGDERARQPKVKRRWSIISESVFLAIVSLYFVTAPPLIALFAQVAPGPSAIVAFALFIITLIAPLFLLPRNATDAPTNSAEEPNTSRKHHVGYRWLPVITVANLLIFQFILKLFLRHCPGRLLIIEGGQDKVVVVDTGWLNALGANVELIHLPEFPHSDLSQQQQIELASVIRNWLARI